MNICHFCGKDCDGEYHTDCYNVTVRQLPLEQRLGISDKPSLLKRTLLKTALAVVAGLGIYGVGKWTMNVPNTAWYKARQVFSDLQAQEKKYICSIEGPAYEKTIRLGDTSIIFLRRNSCCYLHDQEKSGLMINANGHSILDNGIVAGYVDELNTKFGWIKPSAELQPKLDAYYHKLLDAYLKNKE